MDNTSNSEIKVEPIELGANPTRPAELESASSPRAPNSVPGLSASHENVARLATIPTSVPWDAGHLRQCSPPPPATSTLRSNNAQGPLPLLVISTAPEDDPRGSSLPTGSAIPQADGGSTPPPIQESEGSAPLPMQGLTRSSTSGEASERNVSSDDEADDEASESNVPLNGIIAPPNSEAPSSTIVSSSPPSTRSYDSNTKTVLDVGIVLHTAETESEQGDVSPSPLTDEVVEENELRQYLEVVGWKPRHENVATVVGDSEAAGSELADSELAASELTGSELANPELGEREVEKVWSAHSEPTGESADSRLGYLPTRGLSI